MEMEGEPEITQFRPDRPGIRKVLGDLEAEIHERLAPGRIALRHLLKADHGVAAVGPTRA